SDNTMMRSRVGWVMTVASMLALWGCAQNSAGQAKSNRMQEEILGLTAARDQLRKDLTGVKDQKSRLQAQVDQLPLERDESRRTLAARIAERDHTQAQLEQLRKGVRGLLEQLDAMAPTAPAAPATPAEQTTNTSASAN